MRAFTTHMRLQVEYNLVVWSSHLGQDIEKLEKMSNISSLNNCLALETVPMLIKSAIFK